MTLPGARGSADHGGLPAEKEKMAAAKTAAVGLQEPEKGLLHCIADAHASQFDGSAMRAAG